MLPLLICLFLAACLEELDPSPEPVGNTRVFDFNEKVILKAIANFLKEQGYVEPRVNEDAGKVETDYFIKGDFRTKVEATVKKIGRRERTVTISVITEQKSSSQWKPKKMLDKEDYDKIFDEIEMEIYRELAKGE